MFQPKSFSTYARVTNILLFLMLIGFEWVLSLPEGNLPSFNQAALQRARSQILVNAAYTLVYRPAIEHGRALHDLQTILPVFEHEETLLQTDMLPDVQDLLQQARTDYLPLTTAMQSILVHPHSVVTPLELNIVALHEHSYLITINALILILPRNIESRAIQLFVIQIVIEVVFLTLFVIFMTTFVRKQQVKTSEQTSPKPFLQRAFFMRRLLMFLLVCLLMGLELVPLRAGNDAASFNQAALQRLRCEIFGKAALVLTYRPGAERAQALSDLQVSLPLFQQEQAALLTNPNAGVHQQVQEATVAAQTMSRAVQALLMNAGTGIDPMLITTIVSQTPVCFSVMNGIVGALQTQNEQQAELIFWAEMAIEGTLILFFAVLLVSGHDPFVSQEQRKARESVVSR